MLGLDVETIISLVDLEVLHAAAGSHYRKTDRVRDEQESQQRTRDLIFIATVIFHFCCHDLRKQTSGKCAQLSVIISVIMNTAARAAETINQSAP